MIGESASVEHDLVDAGGLGALGDQLTDPDAVGLLVALDGTHIGLDYFDASINRVAAWIEKRVQVPGMIGGGK